VFYFRNKFILLLCLLSLEASAGKPRILKGIIINCVSRQPVSFADIYNESKRKGLYADSSGHFIMSVDNGDTLVIQSMAYFPVIHYVNNVTSGICDTLKLCPKEYNLGEVSIELPGTYQEFKHSFLTISPKEAYKIEGLPEPKYQEIPSLLDTNYLTSDHFAIYNPIDYLYYTYSREEKSKRKVFYLERQKREQFIIDKKFNRALIMRMTGLEGDSITEFIIFCNFSHEFLYYATELEIVESIDRKFQEFLTEKEISAP
jgi:hypothetical protein